MGFIKGFGFEVFRLREARSENEFLIYNIIKKKYNLYSQKRAIEFLLLEFSRANIDFIGFAKEKLALNSKISEKVLLKNILDEEIELIDNVGFKPTKDRIFTKNGKIYFNTFEFIETLDYNKYKLDIPMTYEEFIKKAPYHYKLFLNLHGGNDKAVQDTLLKLADKIQYPYEKAQDCLIFYPGEGAGKGILYKYVLQPIFKQYSSKILMRKLNNDFNAYLRECLVLVLEEGKRDTELIETLKEIVTESSMLINEKGKNQQEEDIYFLTLVFSNNMNPIDLGKRRGSYHLSKSLGSNVEESQNIGKELCENLPNETETLLQYLHNLEFLHQNALMPFNTIAKEQVTDLNKSPLELFYDFIITFPNLQNALQDLYFRRYNNKKQFIYAEIEILKGVMINYIAKDEIKDGYNNFCHLEGFRSNLIRHNKDIVQLWSLFNLSDNDFKRIVIKDGVNAGRKLDHVDLSAINKNINIKFMEKEK